MQVLRVPPYNLNVTLDVASANTVYNYAIVDLADSSETIGTVTSNATKEILIPLSSKYDTQYKITVGANDTYVDVVRPYINPNTKGSTATEISEYKNYELIARSLIDTYIKDGFYNKKVIINTSGNGSDYFPVWYDANKVLKVYENNLLVYDCDNEEDYEVEYRLLADKSAIYKIDVATASERRNRMEHDITKIATAHGDLGHVAYVPTDFPKGVDYDFVLDVGHLKVPSDVEAATDMLIEDIKCGKLDYYKRYITSYNTDQFRIQFDKGIVYGTGNLLVDKILEKYIKSITKPGVL